MTTSDGRPDATPMSAEFGLRARLQAVQPRLTRSRAALAEFLLEHPELPVRLSIDELAVVSGISSPTITRLCKLLGYSGYRQLRISAAADFGRSAGQTGLGASSGSRIDPGMGDEQLLRTFVATHVRAIQASADLVDLPSLRRAAATVAKSEQVDVYGTGGSSQIAGGLADRLYQIGLNARAWSDLQMGLMSGACLGPSSVGIGVSSSGTTFETVEMLSFARSAGAYTIAITSDPESALASYADVVIRTAPPADYANLGTMTTSHAQVLAADLLYVIASWQNPERTGRLARDARAAVQRHQAQRRSRPNPAEARDAD